MNADDDFADAEARATFWFHEHPEQAEAFKEACITSMINVMSRKALVLGRGYFIMDTRPGGINTFRPLYDGNPPRVLATLAAFERSLREDD